jgi:hypothetical protein
MHQRPTDGHDSYPRAIRSELGKDVRHRTSRYLNTGWNKITGASKAATDRCAASSLPAQRPGSVEVTTNSATSSAPVPVPVPTNMFPPTAAGCSSSVGPQLCSAFCKPRDHARLHLDAGYTSWREL